MNEKNEQNTPNKQKKKIIIEGITEAGAKFRPSNWADRMSGSLSTFRNRRIYYSPLLQPIYRDGYKCVALDPSLKESNPELYQSILDFAKNNNLRICNEDEDKEENETVSEGDGNEGK